MADLKSLPTARDVCVVCNNVRYVDGRKPSFIDHTDSWFVIPLNLIRFVEVPRTSFERSEGDGLLALPPGPEPTAQARSARDDADSESDLLRRIREA